MVLLTIYAIILDGYIKKLFLLPHRRNMSTYTIIKGLKFIVWKNIVKLIDWNIYPTIFYLRLW